MSDIIYQPAGRAGEYSEWAVNLYAGCDHGCKYCYVPAVRRISPQTFFANAATPYKDILKKLTAAARKLQGTIHTPIMFSFTSDPYQHDEAKHQTTRAAIGILKEFGFNVCLLTKAGTRAERDFDLLEKGDIIAASLTFTDEADSLKWEPHAALPQSRIALLRAAKAHGLETWASLEPVIDPGQSLELIRTTVELNCVDLYKLGTINYCKTVSAKIDWRNFARAATCQILQAGKAYYLKDDLFKFCPPGTDKVWNPHNVCQLHSPATA